MYVFVLLSSFVKSVIIKLNVTKFYGDIRSTVNLWLEKKGRAYSSLSIRRFWGKGERCHLKSPLSPSQGTMLYLLCGFFFSEIQRL